MGIDATKGGGGEEALCALLSILTVLQPSTYLYFASFQVPSEHMVHTLAGVD